MSTIKIANRIKRKTPAIRIPAPKITQTVPQIPPKHDDKHREGHLHVRKHLTVDGSAKFHRHVTVDESSKFHRDVKFDKSVKIHRNLKVAHDTTLHDTSIDGKLDIANGTEIAIDVLSGDVIIENGDLTLTQGNVTLTDGDATLTSGNLTLADGDATLTSGNLTLTDGDATLTSGNLTLTDGDATLTSGNLLLTQGNATLTSGNLTLTDGDATLTSGNLLLTQGNATLTSGNLTLTDGDATLTSGNLLLTQGNVTLTDGDATLTSGNLLVTSGNLTLTDGDATLTSGNLTLTDGNLTLTDGDLTMTSGTVHPSFPSYSLGPSNSSIGGIDANVYDPRFYYIGGMMPAVADVNSIQISLNNATNQPLYIGAIPVSFNTTINGIILYLSANTGALFSVYANIYDRTGRVVSTGVASYTASSWNNNGASYRATQLALPNPVHLIGPAMYFVVVQWATTLDTSVHMATFNYNGAPLSNYVTSGTGVPSNSPTPTGIYALTSLGVNVPTTNYPGYCPVGQLYCNY